jgi:hypothetical protein
VIPCHFCVQHNKRTAWTRVHCRCPFHSVGTSSSRRLSRKWTFEPNWCRICSTLAWRRDCSSGTKDSTRSTWNKWRRPLGALPNRSNLGTQAHYHKQPMVRTHLTIYSKMVTTVLHSAYREYLHDLTVIISIHSINWLVFVMSTRARTDCLHMIYTWGSRQFLSINSTSLQLVLRWP